jgi:hypothetical protein
MNYEKNTFYSLSLSLVIGLAILFSFPAFASAAVDCTNTGVTGVTQIECEALMAIYNSTNGSEWTTSTNWNTASAVSTWTGISVSGGHVTNVNLYNKNLVGTLPTEIGNLTYLTNLNLGLNTLSGSIPTSIGNLVNVTTLNLFTNNLSGSIPAELDNLTKLTTIYLHYNQFTGTIPSFSNLTTLATLYLDHNQLTGSVPTGFSTTLRTLTLRDNYLSGVLPIYISSIPLTSFTIQNNNFIFSDFETNFSSYCTGSSTLFTYNPQRNIDTIRSLTFNSGETLTITPSVSVNSNDIYQWYKDGVAISGATSRVYSKIAQDVDMGVYTYRITNSIIPNLTLQSNNITVSINPIPPTPSSVYYIVGATDVYVRGSISVAKDIVQRYLLPITNNQNINFGTTYLISSTTLNSVTSYQAGSVISGSGDDSTPIYTTNVGYIMSNHGLLVPVITSVGHDKTSADIGSIWSVGRYQFIIAEVSGNTITLYPVPTDSVWKMYTTVLTPLVHVSGATHTGNIVVTSQATVQKYPVVKNVSRHILINGVTEATSSDSTYAGYADFLDITEEFDLIDPSTMVTTNNPFNWNDATSTWMHVKNVYRATAGNTVVHSTYDVVRPMSVSYMGMIQSGALPVGSYDHQYYYIPKTKPIGAYDFKSVQLLDTSPASQVTFTNAYIDDTNSPPDRQIIFLKKNSESNYDLGFAIGYSPISTSTRSCVTNNGTGCWWIYTTKKTYPVYIGDVGVVDDVTYDAYAYRQFIDSGQYGINKSAYWNNQDGHDYVYVDYHESVTDDVTVLPSSYTGKAIRVVESENISLTQTNVPASGVVLSTTGENTYGYAVLELYDDIVPPVVSILNPVDALTVSSPAVNLSAAASDNVAVSSVQFIIDGTTSYISSDLTSPYSLTWDSTIITDGPHSLVAVARDTSGNYATSSAITFSVHNAVSHTSGNSVQSQIANLTAMGNTKLADELKAKYLTPDLATTTFTFTRDLKLGTKHSEVKLLQQFLNTHGFLIDTKGQGSPGQETTLFGKLTQQALIKFQKANKIKPAVGYFGPVTRKVISKL